MTKKDQTLNELQAERDMHAEVLTEFLERFNTKTRELCEVQEEVKLLRDKVEQLENGYMILPEDMEVQRLRHEAKELRAQLTRARAERNQTAELDEAAK